ncbi:unnamed protein product [Prunus armeniaca]|uniref:Uncharacterized protein n=1 Tax=Prunus armeniaca TaxID=36596 RepID=A0A6J5X3A1_PRUAR|nr:unnamed protein product [Prunus armeniaca]CAB4305388.1 unnamed protein product [Prunus armeniaca]
MDQSSSSTRLVVVNTTTGVRAATRGRDQRKIRYLVNQTVTATEYLAIQAAIAADNVNRNRHDEIANPRDAPYAPPDHPEACPEVVVTSVQEVRSAISEHGEPLNLVIPRCR